jgi:L-aspartate semialdehyde sulfurtransferase ferredoxin
MILFTRDTCDFCGVCVGVCPTDAIYLARVDLTVDHEACIDCGFCVAACPTKSLHSDAAVPTGQPVSEVN